MNNTFLNRLWIKNKSQGKVENSSNQIMENVLEFVGYS